MEVLHNYWVVTALGFSACLSLLLVLWKLRLPATAYLILGLSALAGVFWVIDQLQPWKAETEWPHVLQSALQGLSTGLFILSMHRWRKVDSSNKY